MAEYNKILRNGKNTLIPLSEGGQDIVITDGIALSNITLNGLITLNGVNYAAGSIICAARQTDLTKRGVYVVVDGGDWNEYDVFKPRNIYNRLGNDLGDGTKIAKTFWYNNIQGDDDTLNAFYESPSQILQNEEVFKVRAAARTNVSISSAVVNIDNVIPIDDDLFLFPNQNVVAENNIYKSSGGNWEEYSEFVNDKPPKLIIVEEGTTDNIQSLWIRYSDDGSDNTYRNISRIVSNSGVLTGTSSVTVGLTNPQITTSLSAYKTYEAVIESDIFIFEEDPITAGNYLEFAFAVDGTSSQIGFGKYKRRLINSTSTDQYAKVDLLNNIDLGSGGYQDTFGAVTSNSNYWLIELRWKCTFQITNPSNLDVGLMVSRSTGFPDSTILAGTDITIHEVKIN